MVDKAKVISLFKCKINEQWRNGKPFKINSVVGSLNNNKPVREWFKKKYPQEYNQTQFFIENSDHFTYDYSTGFITVNSSKHQVIKYKEILTDLILKDEDIAKEVINLRKKALLTNIFTLLQDEDVALSDPANIDGDNTSENKLRGENGVKVEDIMSLIDENILKCILTKQNSDAIAKFIKFIRSDCKSFVTVGKCIVYFDPSFKYQTSFEESNDDLKEANLKIFEEFLILLLEKFCLKHSKGANIDDLKEVINNQLKVLSKCLFNRNDFNCIIDEKFKDTKVFKISADKKMIQIQKGNDTVKISNEQQFFETKGKVLLDLNGEVATDGISIMYNGGSFGLIRFIFDPSTFDISLQERDAVTFDGKYNEKKRIWCATIKSINSVDEIN